MAKLLSEQELAVSVEDFLKYNISHGSTGFTDFKVMQVLKTMTDIYKVNKFKIIVDGEGLHDLASSTWFLPSKNHNKPGHILGIPIELERNRDTTKLKHTAKIVGLDNRLYMYVDFM